VYVPEVFVLSSRPRRTGQAAFEDAALLKGPLQRKRITRVQMVIAKDEVESSVEGRGAGLGNDIDAAAARARVFGGVRIVIDLDFLDRGGRDSRAAGFYAVHQDGHAAGRHRAGIEKSRHRSDVVLVENRQVIECLPVQSNRVAVGRRIGAEFRGSLGNAHF
jgi:hypothetical protein